MKESVEMLKEAERIGAVKIMIPTSELKFMLQQVSKVEEMQKVLQQTRTGISNAYEFGYLKETDQNDVHNMLERINEVLKGAESQ